MPHIFTALQQGRDSVKAAANGFHRQLRIVLSDGITVEAVWSDPLVVAVPAWHPLLIHKRIPLREMLRYPLVLCDPKVHARPSGCCGVRSKTP